MAAETARYHQSLSLRDGLTREAQSVARKKWVGKVMGHTLTSTGAVG
jgi:hypothetical protein